MEITIGSEVDIKGGAKTGRRPWNPLADDPTSCQASSYAGFPGSAVVHPLVPEMAVDAALAAAHDELRARVMGEGFPCVGAKSAFNRRTYRFGLYPELVSRAAVRGVCHDLYEFSHEFQDIGDQFVTFVAMFRGPAIESELHFEELLWQHLQCMHALDGTHFTWDPQVGTDPADPEFSFSIGGRAFFVVGLHPRASRMARTVSQPTLVFNLHEQFDHLRARGKFETMKRIIRARDMAYQGSVNPVLKDFGESSEARQYSGRAVPDDWICPFHKTHTEEK
jgi:uncharacterized protein